MLRVSLLKVKFLRVKVLKVQLWGILLLEVDVSEGREWRAGAVGQRSWMSAVGSTNWNVRGQRSWMSAVGSSNWNVRGQRSWMSAVGSTYWNVRQFFRSPVRPPPHPVVEE